MGERRMTKRHFIDEYTTLVRDLMARYPLDEAMSIAVGGGYDEAGPSEVRALQACGLEDGMSIIDFGCGSGRLAKHLGLTFERIEYLGIDIVQELLDYAASKSPSHFRFVLNHEMSLPAPNNSADMIAAFSVFTHLLHEESYIYLQETKRVLRPGGSIVFSFLESRHNWPIFEHMIDGARRGEKTHLNMFIERPQIEAWASHLGMEIMGYEFGVPHSGYGQTVTMLKCLP
jgi:SAM-dependent methyltransferase